MLKFDLRSESQAKSPWREEMESPLEPPERDAACLHLVFQHGETIPDTSDLQNPKHAGCLCANNKFVLFKANKFVISATENHFTVSLDSVG